VVIVIFFAVAFVFLFVFFLVWLLLQEGIGATDRSEGSESGHSG
jgi:hypothetical protein